MEFTSKSSPSVIKARLVLASREFNSIGKRFENIGLPKADYDTVHAILLKHYTHVTAEINAGRDVPGLTDVLEGAKAEREKAREEKKAKKAGAAGTEGADKGTDQGFV